MAVTVVGRRAAICTSAIVRFQQRGGPTGIIVNQLQILGTGSIYISVVRGKHAPNTTGPPHDRRGLDGAHVGIQKGLYAVRTGKYGAVGNIWNDDAVGCS